MAPDLSAATLPRVLIVSRRTVRKNKFVDFVGEYHLDLIVKYGAVPIIVPRVSGVHTMLDSFEPIHGVLLCEGEDIDSSLYQSSGEETATVLSPDELEEIKRAHASDTAVDREKDSIEMKLAKLCLERNIPFFGICRGSQVLNVACGGTLYLDVEKELGSKLAPGRQRVVHMEYDNYDGHRHGVQVVGGTPLHRWFDRETEIRVNSYHHQGVKRLAKRFVAMAFAPDGLIEGFYDPDGYNPEEGKFLVGLQFHPERMRRPDSNEFDYSGCSVVYQEFVKAVIAYQKKLINQEMEMRRKVFVPSFSITTRTTLNPIKESHAQFLESDTSLSVQQEKRLKQMGATVRNGAFYLQRVKLNEDREKLARNILGKMSAEKLSDLLSFYHMMGHICSQVLEKKLHGIVNHIAPN